MTLVIRNNKIIKEKIADSYVKRSYYIDKELTKFLDNESKKFGYSSSYFLNNLIRKALKK